MESLKFFEEEGRKACIRYNAFLQNYYKDPYFWQLLKSVVYFCMGIKLFNDIAKHFVECNWLILYKYWLKFIILLQKTLFDR